MKEAPKIWAAILPNETSAGFGCSSHDLLVVARWLTGDDTGVSSKYIAAVWIAGQVIPSKWGDSTPSDAPDLGRCVRLLELAPSIRNVFPVLREASPVWAAYVDHWDELTALNNRTTGADWYRVVTGWMRDLRSSANAEVRHGAKDPDLD